jgi:hypothetical protein
VPGDLFPATVPERLAAAQERRWAIPGPPVGLVASADGTVSEKRAPGKKREEE